MLVSREEESVWLRHSCVLMLVGQAMLQETHVLPNNFYLLNSLKYVSRNSMCLWPTVFQFKHMVTVTSEGVAEAYILQ